MVIPNAPSGENTSPAGTEKFPVTGNKFMTLNTFAAFAVERIVTYNGEVVVYKGEVVTYGAIQ